MSFFCIREEIPVIFVHQLTYLLHRLFKYTGWFSLGWAIGNVNQNWSNKIWPIEKAMHLLRTFDAQAQRQLILFKSLFTTTSTRKKKTWTLCVCLYFSSEIKLTFWFDEGSIPYCFFSKFWLTETSGFEIYLKFYVSQIWRVFENNIQTKQYVCLSKIQNALAQYVFLPLPGFCHRVNCPGIGHHSPALMRRIGMMIIIWRRLWWWLWWWWWWWGWCQGFCHRKK